MALGFLKKHGRLTSIDVMKISENPYQPRQNFSEQEITALANSIIQSGLIQPISVRTFGNGYELIAGERRLRAFKMLGKKEISAIVYEISDVEAALWSLTENLQRADLDFFEEAAAMEKLCTLWNTGRDEVAHRLSLSPSTLSNKIRLLRLSERTREVIRKSGLTEHHARELLRLETEEKQFFAANHIAKEKLNVPKTELYISSLLEKPKPKAKVIYMVKDIRLFINTFEHAVDMMKKSGIGATVKVDETPDTMTYSVVINKFN